jgi:hypothetical protein
VSDEDTLKLISEMDFRELFDYVMDQPELLTDSYYRAFGRAIEARYKELTS